MIETKSQWNGVMKALRAEMAMKSVSINSVRELILDLHGFNHSSLVSGNSALSLV